MAPEFYSRDETRSIAKGLTSKTGELLSKTSETGWSPALRITREVRSNDRVSTAVTVIFLTSKGVNSRASRPRTSRRGKKISATLATVADQIGDGHFTVNGGHLSLADFEIAD